MAAGPGQGDESAEPVTVEVLIALRDGQLDDEQEAQVLERLRSDPAAAQLLSEVDQTEAILRRVQNTRIPPDVSEALRARLSREVTRRAEGGGEHPAQGS